MPRTTTTAAATATTTSPPAKKAAAAKAAPAKRAPRKTAAPPAAGDAPVTVRPAPAGPDPTQGPQLANLPVDEVLPNVRNVRRDVGDVAELANSIQQVGLLEPLVVAPDLTSAGEASWVLIAGHRRHAAVQKLGWTTVPCLIRTGLNDEASQILAMLVENLQRTDLTPIEEATAYEQLTIAGFKVGDIAKRTGRARSTVEQRLQLMDLPETTRAKVHDRQITLTEAEALLEFADDPAIVAKLEQAADGTGDFRWELERARRHRDERRKRETTVAELKARGVRVLSTSEAAQLYSQAISRYGLTEEQHASCPGHAASVTQNGLYTTFYCLEPNQHATPAGGGQSPAVRDPSLRAPAGGGAAEPTAEWAEQQRRGEEEKESCEIAARLRKAFILGITTARAPLPADDVRAIAAGMVATCAQVVLEPEPEQWCRWLTRDELDDRDWEEWERLLAGMLAPDGGRDPHRALLAMLAGDLEAQLQKAQQWNPAWLGDGAHGAGGRLPWLMLLCHLGYELSAWEQAKVDAALAHAAEQAAADAGQDDEDDGASTEPL